MEHKFWKVGALGLSQGEFTLLTSMAGLTRSRAVDSYVISAAADIADSHIIILNVDDLEAVSRWRTLVAKPRPPVTVLYVSEEPTDPQQRYLLRPFGPAKLLALLDSIVKEARESAHVWKKPTLSQASTNATSPALRALVVDDSPTVCKQLELELRNFNIRADIAETGERGLELLSLNKYDLIFLDVVLPGTDGYQVCKDIRKNPRTKQTPVIMLTSKSSPFDKVRGSLAGCSAYLTKPVDYNMFREAVEKHVGTIKSA